MAVPDAAGNGAGGYWYWNGKGPPRAGRMPGAGASQKRLEPGRL
ncbi:hypothetical protein [Pannonibacter phragmitetus]|nr:hypothetical protein [Pannonibacter phragmitetus]